METKMSSISSRTWRRTWWEPAGRMTPGRERSTRSRARAVCSAPDSSAARRASICASTCARRSLSAAPTARFSSGGAGFSQLSVICVRTPDLRPSHASRKSFQAASSFTAAPAESKRARTSAKGRATPSASSDSAVLLSVDMPLRKSAPRSRGSVSVSAGKSACELNRTARGGAVAPPLGLFRRRRRGGFGLLDQYGKARSVLHGDIREHLAVKRDAGSFQPVDELAIADAILTGGGADTLNPEAAVLPLSRAAVALGIAIGAIGGFLRGLVQLAFGEKEPFGSSQVLLAPRPALGAAFYACHGFAPCSWISRSRGTRQSRKPV